jgi:hypothetical protein
MQFRDDKTDEHDPDTFQRISFFNGTHYHNLRKKKVEIDGKTYNHQYFDDPRDIALAFYTDGFQLFKWGKYTCQPGLITNLNLPDTESCLTKNKILSFIISGPRAPKHFDTFLEPLLQEAYILAQGFVANSPLPSVKKKFEAGKFIQRAYFVRIDADGQARKKLLDAKGSNGVRCCHVCKIQGYRAHKKTIYYASLGAPEDIEDYDQSKIGLRDLKHSYDPYDLPLWDDASWHQEAQAVESSEGPEQASKDVGINSLCIWAKFPGIVFHCKERGRTK